jgi:hypothetical protein
MLTTSVQATSIGQSCDLLIIHLLTKPSIKQHVFSLQNNDCYVKQLWGERGLESGESS